MPRRSECLVGKGDYAVMVINAERANDEMELKLISALLLN